MRSRSVLLAMVWLAGACLSPDRPSAAAADRTVDADDGSRPGADPGPRYEMDLANRTVVQRIGTEVADPASRRFVQFEVVRVENPRRLPLSFEVRYEDETGRRTWLGSFALFPPDNPGKFLVPTGGRLRAGGAVVVTMVVLQEPRPDDRVRVTLRRFSFRES